MCGHRSGVDTALVLTGEATTEDVEKSEIKPNSILTLSQNWAKFIQMLKSKQTIFFSFAVLMFALGASDAMRGVFSFIFTEHFSLNANGLSNIVTISYIGIYYFWLLAEI